jgi:hypothetical protein
MARNLESELARLSRTVRRRVALQQTRDVASSRPIGLSAASRIAHIWERTRVRLLRWLGRGRRG